MKKTQHISDEEKKKKKNLLPAEQPKKMAK